MTATTTGAIANLRTMVVEWGHCDPAGIVFNPRYFEWFDAATAALFVQALGMTKAAMIKRFAIVGIPLVTTRAVFTVPCAYGETVGIETEVAEFRRSSFDVHHRLSKADGALAVEAWETRVWVGRHPDKAETMKAKPIPDEVLDRFAGHARRGMEHSDA